MSKTYHVISDDLDLTKLDKDGNKVAYDNFKDFAESFKQETNHIPISFETKDSVASDEYKNIMKQYDFYMLVSTSGKVINNRIYDYESLKQNVADGAWVKPFSRPVLKNHDQYYGDPVGRFKSTFFVDHESQTVTAKSSQSDSVPDKVMKAFKDVGAFSTMDGGGTGSTLARFTPDASVAGRILDGLFVTVSQSSYAANMDCTICGKGYFKDCEHLAGRTYDIEGDDGVVRRKTCYVKSSDFKPIEGSLVNNPANDTSIIVVFDKNSKTVLNQTSDNSKFDNTENISEDTQEENNQIVTDSAETTEKVTEDTQEVETLKTENIKTEDGTATVQPSALKGFVKDKVSNTATKDFQLTDDSKARLDDFLGKLEDDALIAFAQIVEDFAKGIPAEQASEEQATEDEGEGAEENVAADSAEENTEPKTEDNDVAGDGEKTEDKTDVTKQAIKDKEEIYGKTQSPESQDAEMDPEMIAMMNNMK